MKVLRPYTIGRITIALMAIVILFLCNACAEKPEVSEAIVDRADVPRLKAMDISTIISDSGIIRYRINAKEWYVYDRKAEPYWDFPKGLHFERFDSLSNVDAQITCKHAIYHERIKLWELNDSVRATNLKGERFETEQLFWDQNSERIYSDSTILIIQTDKQIEGVGFESNQTMSRYTIRNPKGIIPVDSE